MAKQVKSHWLYKGKILEEAPEDAFGFVYLIKNNENSKVYIGRKYFRKTRRKPLTKKQKAAGRKRRMVVKSDSNWKSYTGSNHNLNEDIDKLGKEKFEFHILALGYTKGQVNFLEETLQHKMNVILQDKFYNDSISSRRFVNLKTTENFKQQILELDRTINEKFVK